MPRFPVFFCTLVLMLAPACRNRPTTSVAAQNPALITPSIAPLTQAIAADTTRAESWYQRGTALHRMKLDSLALEDFYHAARLDTGRADYASTIGDLLFEHKDVNAATPWLLRALRHNPSDPKAHLKMAKLMLFTKEYGKAIGETNIVLKADAFNPEAYFLKGMVYKELSQTQNDTGNAFGKALSSFQTALNVAPDYREAVLQLAQLYLSQGNKLGLQYYDNAFKLDTTDVFPLYAKGMYLQAQKHLEGAKEQYKRCVTHDPQYGNAIFSTGFILLQQDSLEKARRQFDLVTKIQPNNAGAYYNRGLCSELMHHNEAAAEDYRQALVFDKNYKTAQDGLRRVGGK